MKRLVLILVILLVFTGCVKNTPTEAQVSEYVFSCAQSGIFPFYCVGQDNMLWRVERQGAYSLDMRVSYPSGSSEQCFVRYIKDEDIVVFATDITVNNGITLARLAVQSGGGKAEIIAENVILDTVRLQADGNLLYIDSKNTLYFRRDGINIAVEAGVAQCEFVGEDTFLFRLQKGSFENGEFSYPVYFATAEYRNHLMDALDIIGADSENGKAYIIKNKHTVKKRAASVEVADCYVYADGEVLFDIPSVVLSQFDEEKHIFLISCNENEPTLKYDLYRIDGSEPVLKASDIISGKYISPDRDVFAYEALESGIIKTSITDHTDSVVSYQLGQNCSLESIYYCRPYTYVYYDKKLILLENGVQGRVIDGDISAVKNADGILLCVKENTPPYSIYALRDNTLKILAATVQNDRYVYSGGNLYYYTGESNDLMMADVRGSITAFTSNADVSIGFIYEGATVALAKSDDKSLYIVSRNGITDTKLKIKRFIN